MLASTFAPRLRPFLAAVSRGLSDIPSVVAEIPLTKGGTAFEDDLRATSGVGAGDGLVEHTEKWLQGEEKSPMQYISEVEPIKVEGLVAISHGQYIDLRGTSYEHPAVCKYTGYRFYSDVWKSGGAAH